MISAMLRRMHSARLPVRACHFRIMVHEMAQPTEALPRIVEEIIGPNHAAMRQILSRLLGTGRPTTTSRGSAPTASSVRSSTTHMPDP